MNLSMTGELATAYKSGSQRAKNVTEAWGADNFYCPNCSSPRLDWLKGNTKANDYRCPSCQYWFQLKSQKTRIGKCVTDGAYGAMMDAICDDRTPNFYFLHYDLGTWSVKNLLLVPSFAFPPSAIIKRNPTTPKGRNQPWIGCNIALHLIPADARIALVTESNVVSTSEVREQFKKVKPFKQLNVSKRGWTLDVLTAVRSLKKTEFTNQDIYAIVPQLQKLHPGNNNVQAKIRQQLQTLREMGLLIHLPPGKWRLSN
jgi:type II restriction enzyme